jgi:hypothetical protein
MRDCCEGFAVERGEKHAGRQNRALVKIAEQTNVAKSTEYAK